LRITGGTARNRKLKTPKPGGRNSLRPTSDRVREALFSILGEHVYGARVLDLFTGTGSLGLETLSRGADFVVFVDQLPQSLKLVQKNILLCFHQARTEIIRLNLENKASFQTIHNKFAEHKAFNLIFLDPPYEKKLAEKALTMVEKTGLLTADGIVVAEERWSVTLPEQIGMLFLTKKRRYGETGIWIYQQEY